MSSTFDEIYLETDEEVTSAIEKIKKSKKKNIALVLPRNAVLGQSIVNLKLIYRQTLSEGKQVALISPDKTTRSLADRVGFSVAETAGAASFSASSHEPESPKPDPVQKEAPAPAPKLKEESPEPAVPIEKQRFDAAPAATDTEDSDAELADVPEEPLEEQFLEAESHDADNPELVQEDAEAEVPKEEATPMAKSYTSSNPGMIPTRGNLRMYRQPKRKPLIMIVVGLLIVLLGAGVAGAVMIPSATVKVAVLAQPFNETVTSTVSIDATTLDPDKSILPGKLQSIEQETKISTKATGKKDIGAKASGTVTLFNSWDSLPHTYAAGTKLVAKNGNEYVLKAETTVPGASSTISAGQSVISPGQKEATVEASAPGDGYNIAATTFSIPSLSKAQQEKIYATSSTAFKGGTSDLVTVVTQSDIDKLTDTAKNQNKEDGTAKLKESASDSIIIDKAVQVVSQDATSSVAADATADSVEVTVKGKFQVITFMKEDHKNLLQKLLANKIPQGQSLVTEGEGVEVDTSQFELNLVNDKTLELTNTIKAFTAESFDLGAVRRALVGASPSDVSKIVSDKLKVKETQSVVTPGWWPRMPLWADKIKIELTYTGKN